jgi:predicted metal-dependent peptidase
MSLSPAMRLKQGRTQLLLHFPFFGVLILRLKDVETPSIATMATDGVRLYFNPEFVAGLTAPELLGTLAHECMHPALQHHTRRGTRSPKRWNIAADYAINALIMDAGLTLPAGALYESRFRNLSAERIYNLIAEDQDDESSGSGTESTNPNGASDPSVNGNDSSGGGQVAPKVPITEGGFGQVIDATDPDDASKPANSDQIEAQQNDWTEAFQKAEAIERMAGKGSVGARRSLDASDQATVDWRAVLRNSFAAAVPEDYTWSKPNPRYIHEGLYLASVRKEGVGEIVIGVDCSGSINRRQLGLFQSEMASIIEESRPQRVHVLYFDTRVHRSDVFEQGEPITLDPVGGGGTSFCPCFDFVEEQGIQPQALVIFTDLDGRFPSHQPHYPVLWAATEDRFAPFGEVIPMAAA